MRRLHPSGEVVIHGGEVAWSALGPHISATDAESAYPSQHETRPHRERDRSNVRRVHLRLALPWSQGICWDFLRVPRARPSCALANSRVTWMPERAPLSVTPPRASAGSR